MSVEKSFAKTMHERVRDILSVAGEHKQIKVRNSKPKEVLMQSWPTAISVDQKKSVSDITIMLHEDEHFRGDNPYCVFLDRPTEPSSDPLHSAGVMFMIQSDNIRVVSLEHQRKFDAPLTHDEGELLGEILNYCSETKPSELTQAKLVSTIKP